MDKNNKSNEKNLTEQSESQAGKSKLQRRALVASIAVAGAASLPTQWKKPIVDHILIPAHAQTSPGAGSGTGTGTTPVTSTFTTTATTIVTAAGGAITGVFSCQQDLAFTAIPLNTGTFNTTVTGSFVVTYSQLGAFTNACTDPVGGSTFTSGPTGGGTFTSSSFFTAIPQSFSSSSSAPFTDTGSFTSSFTQTATTTVTSSA